MNLRLRVFCLLPAMLGFLHSAYSQGVTIIPLSQRHVTETKTFNPIIANHIADTLPLPFFDDFTATTGYPSLHRWVDNQVWVNNTFPIGQPNYNVATFDHLDAHGKPYTTLNKNDMVFADSLTSKP